LYGRDGSSAEQIFDQRHRPELRPAPKKAAGMEGMRPQTVDESKGTMASDAGVLRLRLLRLMEQAAGRPATLSLYDGYDLSPQPLDRPHMH